MRENLCMSASDRPVAPDALYVRLAADIGRLIETGTLKPGERLPSVRAMCASRHVSTATVLQAYYLLEGRGLVRSKPRSGYFVSAHWRTQPPEPAATTPPRRSTAVDVSDLVFEVLEATKHREVVPLGSAFPSPMLFPLPRLAQMLGAAARSLDPWATIESLPPGNYELRRAIARRYVECGAHVPLEEIVVTSGAMEALSLSLQTVTRRGDVVAIESPTFYGALQLVEALDLRAVEIATHPGEGVDLGALDQAIRRHPIKACWFMTSFQNPLGSLMPDDKKRELVRLLARHDIPLIEDDVYSELYFGERRPKPAKAYDQKGLVMHCGSYAKCLAPGYRVGWAAPGRYAQAVQRRKIMTTLSTNVHAQAALAEYLRHGAYDHHLRQLRATLERQQSDMLDAIHRHFPTGTRVSQPQGGYFLWLQLPEGVDALAIHRRALRKGISIAPGPIFSPQRGHRNYVRINYGHPWTDAIERAVAEIGRIASAMA